MTRPDGAFGPDGEWFQFSDDLREKLGDRDYGAVTIGAGKQAIKAGDRVWMWLQHGSDAPVYAQAYHLDGEEAVDECFGLEPGTERTLDTLRLAAMSFEAAYGPGEDG